MHNKGAADPAAPFIMFFKFRFCELFKIDAEAADYRCRPERRAKPGVEGSTHYRLLMQ